MKRRGASRKVVNERGARRPKPRKARTAKLSPADLQERLDSAVRQRNDALDQQAATSEILTVISRASFDLEAVFETLVKTAARLCHANKANIGLLRGDRIRLVASVGFSPEHKAYMESVGLTPHRGSVSGRCALDGKIVHVHDVLADREWVMHEAQKLGGFRTALGVPLLRDGVVIGTMFLSRPTVDPFSQKQIRPSSPSRTRGC
jgi:two-component system NtrC family sensor kinase